MCLKYNPFIYLHNSRSALWHVRKLNVFAVIFAYWELHRFALCFIGNTCFCFNGEIWLALQQAVHKMSIIVSERIISITCCHLDDGCLWRGSKQLQEIHSGVIEQPIQLCKAFFLSKYIDDTQSHASNLSVLSLSTMWYTAV